MATRLAVRIRCRARCVRWSRPPVSTGTPRRVREKMTRHVSKTGIPTRRKPTSNASDDGSALCAAPATSAATMKPSGMLPPSPRKIFAGEARLCGRKPRQAPHSAALPTATHVSPVTIASTHAPPEATSAIVLAAPSMLSNRLNALTTATTHRAVTAASTTGPPRSFQPSPAIETSTPTASSARTRRPGDRFRRSSIVPTTARTATPPRSGRVRCGLPAPTSIAIANASMTAVPPR